MCYNYKTFRLVYELSNHFRITALALKGFMKDHYFSFSLCTKQTQSGPTHLRVPVSLTFGTWLT